MNKKSMNAIVFTLLYIVVPALSLGNESRFYENSSARFFGAALRSYELVNEQSSKLHISKRVSRKMFTYWYESRYLGLKKSDKVDNAIVYAYAAYKLGIIEGDFLKDVFEDPLKLISGESNIKSISRARKHWKIGDKDEYKTLLVEYLKFLEERMAQVEKVDLRKMLDMYETD